MRTPPGWYVDESDLGRRWWDGSSWSCPGDDPRIRPGTPTVFGSAVLEFRPDSTWPPAPAGWYPPPLWEPGPGWREPGELWHVVGLGVEAELQELSKIMEVFKAEQEPEAWGVEDLSNIPVVWTPPPSWPQPPPGWSPSNDWKPERAWGRPPTGWQFWQHDTAILKHRESVVHKEIDKRSRALADSIVGIAKLLSFADGLLCNASRMTPLILSPLPRAARHGFAISAPEDLITASKSAHSQLNLAVSNLRTYLLRLAYGNGVPDEWLAVLRLGVVDAKAAYIRAGKAAGEGVLHATIDAIGLEIDATGVELAKLNSSRRHKKRRARFWRNMESLRELLPSLRSDVIERARALGSDERKQITTHTTSWEAAEELAASHLRSLGFSDALRTPVGSDGGFDVEGRGIVAQVKYRANPIGRPDVQRLVGANQHGARSVFYARAGYTQAAIEYAELTDVALFTLDAAASEIQPANEIAHSLGA